MNVAAPRTGYGTTQGASPDQRMQDIQTHIGNRSVGGRFVSWMKNKDGITPKEQRYMKSFQKALADKLGSPEAVNVLFKELQLSPDKPLSVRKMQVAMDTADQMVADRSQYTTARENQIKKGNVPDTELSPSGAALRSAISFAFQGSREENENAARAVIACLGLKPNEEVTDAHIAMAHKLVGKYEECRGTPLHTQMGETQFPTVYFKSTFTNIVANGWDKRTDLLRVDELVALNAYTQIDYGGINAELRAGSLSPLSKTVTDLCISGMKKLPPHNGPVVRGTTLPPAKDQACVRGATTEDEAFTSTSAVRPFDGPHHFTIHSRTGRDVSFLSEYPHEKEILFFPGQKFDVISRTGTYDPNNPVNHGVKIVLKEA